MKKVLLICLIQFSSFQLFSQHLSLNELISFVRKDGSEITEKIVGKGFRLTSAKPREEEDAPDILTWAQGLQEHDSTASAWLTAIIMDKQNRISYQFASSNHYLALLNSIKAFKARKLSSKTEENAIKTTYLGNSYAYELYNGGDTYNITIFTKQDHINKLLASIDWSKYEETSADSVLDTEPQNEDSGKPLYTTNVKESISTAKLFREPKLTAESYYDISPRSEVTVYKKGDLFYYVRVDGLFGYIGKNNLDLQ